jgi:hypothetical protein
MDGEAGKYIYEYFSFVLFRYVAGAEARAMNIRPYKSDPFGVYSEDLSVLNDRYKQKTPYKIAEAYYKDIIKGNKRVEDTWDDYISELESNGLAEFNELILKYPVTGKSWV